MDSSLVCGASAASPVVSCFDGHRISVDFFFCSAGLDLPDGTSVLPMCSCFLCEGLFWEWCPQHRVGGTRTARRRRRIEVPGWLFYKMQHFVPKNVYDVLHPGLLFRKERILYPKNVLDVLLLLLLSLVFFGSFVLKALVYSEKNNDFKGNSVVKSEDMRVSKVSCKKVTELQGKRIFGLSDIFEAT